MRRPILIFDGPDGTGKTTQSLLLGEYLRREFKVPTAYVSLPVYEFPFGKTIGRCLSRWGPEEQISLPSPEDMAVLFSLNRLETLPYVSRLTKKGFLGIFNRGPYSNLFNVARRVLADRVDWNRLSPEEKAERINPILALDQEFLETLSEKSEVVNLFLLLDPAESMELSRQRALATLGGEPDRHERNRELQVLTVRIYRDIADGGVPGHKAHLIEATRGRLSRFKGEEALTELTGIIRTAERVAEVCQPLLRMSEQTFRIYLAEITAYVGSVLGSRWEGGVDFEFRQLLGKVRPDLSETRPELISEVRQKWPGAWQAFRESQELDWQLARSRGILGKERAS